MEEHRRFVESRKLFQNKYIFENDQATSEDVIPLDALRLAKDNHFAQEEIMRSRQNVGTFTEK
ncbi:hypothetical protein PIB30_091333 [Stylosanthes scabra]|uniref:Uncharacterized protein n=1 Tax=Stylosanthes scabra TaxID=79078 RepID=A0ABU6RUX8_9FABA|nr:hypothetical protein [Stylosanthes scabra]